MAESWRDEKIREIIETLNTLNIHAQYEPIKQLYAYLKQWKETGNRIEINIEFLELNKKIIGQLCKYSNQNTYIRLINLNNNIR